MMSPKDEGLVSTGSTISPQEYDAFRNFLERTCGIVLGDNKQYLINSRLNRLMAEQGITHFRTLIDKLERDAALRNQIVDAMTTNETSWFRDKYPFEILKNEILPQLPVTRIEPLRIWSAACSYGQEPYSISMVLQEHRSKAGGLASVEVIATDISSSVLRAASQGEYEDLALARGLAPERRDRFFTRTADGARWSVNSEIKSRVKFKEFNLMSNNFSALGKFDVIFCRNVLIYFSAQLKSDIFRRIAGILKPDGYLFLGGSESIANYSDAFEIVRCQSGVVYRPRK